MKKAFLCFFAKLRTFRNKTSVDRTVFVLYYVGDKGSFLPAVSIIQITSKVNFFSLAILRISLVRNVFGIFAGRSSFSF